MLYLKNKLLNTINLVVLFGEMVMGLSRFFIESLGGFYIGVQVAYVRFQLNLLQNLAKLAVGLFMFAVFCNSFSIIVYAFFDLDIVVAASETLRTYARDVNPWLDKRYERLDNPPIFYEELKESAKQTKKRKPKWYPVGPARHVYYIDYQDGPYMYIFDQIHKKYWNHQVIQYFLGRLHESEVIHDRDDEILAMIDKIEKDANSPEGMERARQDALENLEVDRELRRHWKPYIELGTIVGLCMIFNYFWPNNRINLKHWILCLRTLKQMRRGY